MDLREEGKFDLEKSHGNILNCHSSNISSDWQFSAANLSNQSIGLVPTNNSIATSASVIVSTEKGVPATFRTGANETLDLAWNPPKGNGFLQTLSDIMPKTLSEFPADSAFIERAARFSCFNGGSFSDMVNPYNISEPMNPYSRDGVAIQGPFEVLPSNGLGVHSQINEQNMTEGPLVVVNSIEREVADGCSPREREVVGYVRAHDNTLNECHVPYETEVSGSGRQVESPTLLAGGLPLASKGHSVKKRKRTGQVTDMDKIEGAHQVQDEAAKDINELKQKRGQIPTTTGKSTKHGKDSSPNSDAVKEDYIHVRARRGQATNSHSLAERVRREKISERMKFLQDLVPGCNKVTGKAVMLDEIINYVQSLQRQVEFLSMKLATVNPQLDLNIEGLLAKDIHQSRGGPSMFPFPQDAIHAQLHPSQQGLIRTGVPGTGNPLDALRRPFSSQLMAMSGGGYKDSSQMPNMWDDGLNNVFPVNFDVNSPFNGQEENDSHPSGHTKVEL